MATLRSLLIFAASLATLTACADAAPQGDTPDAAAGASGEPAGAATPDVGAPSSLTFADLTDGCDVLTEEEAEAMLGAPATRRPGGACTWVAGNSGVVRLLFTNLPLEQLDSRSDDRAEVASVLGLLAQLDGAPEYAGDVAGAPAFGAEKDGVSVLFAVPGVQTTAVMSDRPVGEAFVEVSLRTGQPHPERLDALKGLAAEAVEALRARASGGGGAGGSASASAAAEAGASAGQDPLGPARDDLERFYGVYGEAGGNRNFFVAEAKAPGGQEPLPPGHLMVGAMWGDVQPWNMKSVADTRFEQAWVSDFQDAPLVAEFEVGDAGQAVAVTFRGTFEDRGRLPRVGDLPEGW